MRKQVLTTHITQLSQQTRENISFLANLIAALPGAPRVKKKRVIPIFLFLQTTYIGYSSFVLCPQCIGLHYSNSEPWLKYEQLGKFRAQEVTLTNVSIIICCAFSNGHTREKEEKT